MFIRPVSWEDFFFLVLLCFLFLSISSCCLAGFLNDEPRWQSQQGTSHLTFAIVTVWTLTPVPSQLASSGSDRTRRNLNATLSSHPDVKEQETTLYLSFNLELQYVVKVDLSCNTLLHIYTITHFHAPVLLIKAPSLAAKQLHWSGWVFDAFLCHLLTEGTAAVFFNTY